MNNEENNSNIFFSKPNNDVVKPDLMASMPTQNSSTTNTEIKPVNQMTQENSVQMTPNNIQKQEVMTQTPNVTPTINQSNVAQSINNQATSNPVINNQTTGLNSVDKTPKVTPIINQNNINQFQINEQQDSQPANLIAEPTRLNQTFINDNDEELLNAYIGKNYEKIKSRNYNFSALFFGIIYLFYRKMILLGILLFSVSILITLFITPIFPFIINIILCFTFNKLYIKRSNKKINKIKSNNPSATKEMLTALCAEKGGVSIVILILGIFVITVITFIAVTIAIMKGTITIFGNIISDFVDKTNSGLNGEYKGVLMYDSSINMEDEFTITPMEPFQNKSDEYNYEYEFRYEEGTDVFKDCGFSLNAVQGFSDGSELVRQIAEYNSETISNNVAQTTINGINWTWFSKTNSIGTTYYYGTTKNNKAYLFKYEINSSTSPECPTYRQTILNSIIEK